MTAHLQVLVDVLAERIGRSVVLDDPDITVLVASRHFGDADEARVEAFLQRDVGGPRTSFLLSLGVASWTGPGYVPPAPELGATKTRLCHPVRFEGHLLGFLIIIDDDRSMTAAELDDVVQTGRQIAAVLWDGSPEDQRRRDQIEQAVRSLVDRKAGRRSEGRAVLESEGILQPEPQLTMTLVQLPGAEAAAEDRIFIRQAINVVERRRPGFALSAELEGARALIQTWRASPSVVQLKAQVLEMREAVAAHISADPLVAVSKVRSGLDEAWLAHSDATIALRASALVPRLRRTALSSELGPLEVLLRIPSGELSADLLPPELVALRRRDDTGVLTETLRCFLDHGGSTRVTAERLHIHRTSLYYRLERIEELTGISLQDGRVRLVLHLGLELSDLLGSHPQI